MYRVNWDCIVESRGYLAVHCPDHPRRFTNRYVFVHRVVVEQHLGRILTHDEHVHHINEDKLDNRLENLQVVTRAEHARIHAQGKERAMVTLLCPSCGISFTRERRKTHLVKKANRATFCTRQCSGRANGGKKRWGGAVVESGHILVSPRQTRDISRGGNALSH